MWDHVLTQNQVLFFTAAVFGGSALIVCTFALVFIWDMKRKGPIFRWLERLDEYWESLTL